jgi:hypothetical protein
VVGVLEGGDRGLVEGAAQVEDDVPEAAAQGRWGVTRSASWGSSALGRTINPLGWKSTEPSMAAEKDASSRAASRASELVGVSLVISAAWL